MQKLTDELISHLDQSIQIDGNLRIVLIDMTSNALDHLGRILCNANIYCVDENYNVIWQVDSTDGMFGKDSFVAIKKVGNIIEASRFFGTEYDFTG